MTKNPLDMMADLPQEADEEPEAEPAVPPPADDFIGSLVGLSTDDAFWKCLRASVDIRIGFENGEESYYPPSLYPFPWRGGVFIDVEHDVVIAARHVEADPSTEPVKPKKGKR